MTTREEFFATKRSELEAQWEREFQQSEVLRKQKEAREAEEAEALTKRVAREKIEAAAREARVVNSNTETCKVCGTERVPVVAVAHVVYGTDNRCIRKPKQAKATGQLTQDQWDMLSDAEKRDGFIIEFGAGLRNQKILKDHTPEPIPGAPNCYGMKIV